MAKHTPLAERLWAKVDVRGPNDCWRWTASTNHGYGQIQEGARGGHILRAHRVAYELLVGPIPEGLTLDHLCHNADPTCTVPALCLHRRCVNPNHLEPVTMKVNSLRGFGVGAQQARKTHCINGHEFTEANMYRYDDGVRRCRECHLARYRRKYRARGKR